MAAIDFPNSPAVNDTFTAGGRTWIWTGATWDTVATQTITGPAGPAGPAGPEGPPGPGGVLGSTSPILYDEETGFVTFDQEAENAINDVRYAQQTETEITPLDDISSLFDGVQTKFLPMYQGEVLSITNPYRLLLVLNGIVQSVNTQEHAWISPISPRGFFIDIDGYITFSEIPPIGSTFDGRIMAGEATTTKTKNYPFRAIDILLGAL